MFSANFITLLHFNPHQVRERREMEAMERQTNQEASRELVSKTSIASFFVLCPSY